MRGCDAIAISTPDHTARETCAVKKEYAAWQWVCGRGTAVEPTEKSVLATRHSAQTDRESSACSGTRRMTNRGSEWEADKKANPCRDDGSPSTASVGLRSGLWIMPRSAVKVMEGGKVGIYILGIVFVSRTWHARLTVKHTAVTPLLSCCGPETERRVSGPSLGAASIGEASRLQLALTSQSHTRLGMHQLATIQSLARQQARLGGELGPKPQEAATGEAVGLMAAECCQSWAAMRMAANSAMLGWPARVSSGPCIRGNPVVTIV